MIIECGSCNSRFRLDESRITGRGARVRCRKCGEPITVMKEAADAQGGSATAGPGDQDQGLDLRSLLRETMETPLSQAPAAAEPAAVDALQSDFEKMMAEAGKEAEVAAGAPAAPEPEPAAGPAPPAPGGGERPAPAETQEAGQTVDFGPDEKITFLAPGRTEPPVADSQPPREPAPPAARGPARESAQAAPPQAPAAPAGSSEFMMSTADSLDFLKADYDKGEQKAALDISGSLRVAPAAEAGEGKTAPPMGAQSFPPSAPPVEPPPSRSEAIRSELAGLGGVEAAGAAAGKAAAGAPSPPKASAPPPPKAAAPPPPPKLEAAATRPAQPPRRTAPGKQPALKRGQGSQLVRPSVILLLLLFFVLAGGGAYLGFTSDGQKVLRGLVPQIESLWLGGGKPASRYEVSNLIGYYETGAASGKMFIIKGQVTNEGTLRKTGVRVHAALLDAQSRKLAEKTVYAGNIIAGDAIRQATREKIDAAMSNPMGGGLANMDISPGKAVPFMVVFFDAPDGIDSYRLEPRDVE